MKNSAKALPKTAASNPFTTIHVGVINGGTALNIISRHCEFCWDIRSIRKMIRSRSSRILKLSAGPDGSEMQNIAPKPNPDPVLYDAPALGHEPESEAVRLAKELTTKPPPASALRRRSRTVPAGWLSHRHLRPGSIDQAHQPNEYIERNQIEKGEVLLKKLIQSLS